MNNQQIVMAFVLGVTLSSPCVAKELPGSAESDSMNTRLLYSKYCSVCHGDQGDGNTRAAGSLSPRPRNFTAPEAAMELTRERMIASVTYGRPGTAMVGHGKKLTAPQIAALVDYIRATFMHMASAGDQAVLTKHKEGRALFEQNCAVCHGDRGNGAVWAHNGLNPPPRDFTTAEAREILTRERMILSVTHGRAGTAMQPFNKKLTGAQIAQVVDYIRADFMSMGAGGQEEAVVATSPAADPHQGNHQQAPVVATAPAGNNMPDGHSATPSDMSLPMPKGLRGEAAKGQLFYMSNCITCHGAKGDGNGPRSQFITPRPRNFTSDASRAFYNRPALFDAITKGKRGTVMPAWGKVLSEQEIANVAEFVFEAYIKTELDPRADAQGDKKKAN